MIHFYFLYLYRLNLFLKIKNVLFVYNIFNMCMQPCIIFFSLFYSINFMCVLCYKLILINKFIKYNRVNDLCCNIKYLDLYFVSNFSSFVFIYHQFIFLLNYPDFMT
jgi:hypothetical protein